MPLALYRVVHDRGVYPGRQVHADDEDPPLEEVDGLGGVQPATVAWGTEQAGRKVRFKQDKCFETFYPVAFIFIRRLSGP